MFTHTVRDRRRVMQATAVAAVLSGAPSTLDAFRRQRTLRATVVHARDATQAVATLVPVGRHPLARGAIVHLGISVICGEALAHALPERDSVGWGAVAGLAIGLFNLGVIGRRFPAIRALALIPQLADNIAFGAVFALIVDR